MTSSSVKAATCEEEEQKKEEEEKGKVSIIKEDNNDVVVIAQAKEDGTKKREKKKRLVSKIKTIAKQGSNILTRSKPFKTLVGKVFKACDTSKTGDVSKSELYIGLLSIHITLARYAGPAACFPPSREVSDRLFDAADVDESGGIDKVEFENIIMILCAHILSRMFVYYSVLILFVPWFARKVVDSTPHIPNNSYLELAAKQTISISIFMIAIPLIWNAIDAHTHKTIDNNSTRTMMMMMTRSTSTSMETTKDDDKEKSDIDKKDD